MAELHRMKDDRPPPKQAQQRSPSYPGAVRGRSPGASSSPHLFASLLSDSANLARAGQRQPLQRPEASGLEGSSRCRARAATQASQAHPVEVTRPGGEADPVCPFPVSG